MEANPVEAYFDHLEDTETGTDVDMISNGGLIAAAAGGGGVRHLIGWRNAAPLTTRVSTTAML